MRWVLGVALLGMLVGVYLLRDSGPIKLGSDWAVEGRLRALNNGEFKADGAVQLVRDGLSLALETGSRVSWDGVSLPQLIEGRGELDASQPFELGGHRFELVSDGEPDFRVTARLLPGELHLLKGRLRAGGNLYQPGVPFFPFEGALPSAGEDETAGDQTTPGGESSDDFGAGATGQVVDARDGKPVPGAVVRVVFSSQEDGYPAFPEPGSRAVVSANGEGLFRVPSFRPSDPRITLHLEVQHPDFETFVHVSRRDPASFGDGPFITIRLRRALSAEVLFLDPSGHPLSDAAVEVVELSRDRFLGEDSWDEGRTVQRDRPTIRYTTPDGTLRVSKDRCLLYLRDPLLYLWDEDKKVPSRYVLMQPRRDEARGLSWEDWGIVQTRFGSALDESLNDADGYPVADTLIEIEVDGMRPVRLYTDELGRFRFAPRPYPGRLLAVAVRHPRPLPVRYDPPCLDLDDVCLHSPRAGELTVLSPFLWKQRAGGTFDSQSRDRRLAARPAALLTMRLVRLDEEREPEPVPAESVRVSLPDLTLIRRSPDGEVAFAGKLPAGVTQFVLSANGHEPAVVLVPAHLEADRSLDLGTVALERGESLSVAVTGVPPEIRSRIVLRVAPRTAFGLAQQYYFDAATGPTLSIEGLRRGVGYVYGIEGSGLEPSVGQFILNTAALERGIEIPVTFVDEEPVWLTACVADVPPEQTPEYRVVERYYVLGREDPVSCVSYPLPPDGRIGSVRLLPAPWRAEVFVVGPYFRVWHGMRSSTRPRVFEVGLLEPRASTHAFFQFCGVSARRVLDTLSLYGDRNANHEVVRAFTFQRNIAASYLVLDNLKEGSYQLRWLDYSDVEHTFSIEVGRNDATRYLSVPCPDPTMEPVVVFVADTDGNPLSDAIFDRVSASPIVEEVQDLLPLGVEAAMFPTVDVPEGVGAPFLLTVNRTKEVDLSLRAPGFLGARWVVPPGREFPSQFQLEVGVGVKGRIEDPSGLPFDGQLGVRWSRLEFGDSDEAPILITNVEPSVVVGVQRGELQANRFPSRSSLFEFQDLNSEARAKGEFEFRGKQDKELYLRLDETRSIRGTVMLPDGEPAVDTVVSLVAPERAYRFPQRELERDDVRYSAKVDAVGHFEIDGLPLDLSEDFALVAHRDGWTDAVVDPFDPAVTEYLLTLGYPTELILDVGYLSDELQPPYVFRLEHSFDSVNGGLFPVGDVLPTARDGVVFRGVTPGYYRVSWLHSEFPATDFIPPPSAEVVVLPGESRTLRLRIRDPFQSGRVFHNGQALAMGWVVLTSDPGDGFRSRVAKVRDGRFFGPVPDRGGDLYAAVIPTADLDPFPDQTRGEALFQEVSSRSGSRGEITIRSTAHDLTLVFPADALDRYPDLTIELPRYEWTPLGYRSRAETLPVTQNPLRLRLLPAGLFEFKTSTTGASRVAHEVELDQDQTLNLSL